MTPEADTLFVRAMDLLYALANDLPRDTAQEQLREATVAYAAARSALSAPSVPPVEAPDAKDRIIKAAEARIDELEQLCAETYQVVGALLDDTGQFETEQGQKILDNLSRHKRVHDDVLPWASAPVQEGREPAPGLLMSMALRYDHGLGMPGYYDTIRRPGDPSHAQRLASTLRTMHQLWEEVTGNGFYGPEKEADYAALAAQPPIAEE